MNTHNHLEGSWSRVHKEEDFFVPGVEPIHFVQSWLYGDLQEDHGFSVYRFIYTLSNKNVVAGAQVIIYKLPLGLYFAYTPYGIYNPSHKENTKELYKLLAAALVRESRKKVIHLRGELLEESNTPKKNFVPPFVLIPEKEIRSNHMQPRVEWRVPLFDDEQTLFSRTHKKTRYNILLAEKRGIEVRIIQENLESHIDDVISLMKETALRDGFLLHDESYYRQAIKRLDEKRSGFLALAYKGDKLLVASLHAVTKGTAFSVWSGSSSMFREDKPTYLLKWKSIIHAKKMGLSYYLMGGVFKEGDSIYSDWEGLTNFKKGFGGEYVTHGVLFDYVIKNGFYTLYRLLKLTRFYLKKLLGR